jgi:hypothetical protein
LRSTRPTCPSHKKCQSSMPPTTFPGLPLEGVRRTFHSSIIVSH